MESVSAHGETVASEGLKVFASEGYSVCLLYLVLRLKAVQRALCFCREVCCTFFFNVFHVVACLSCCQSTLMFQHRQVQSCEKSRVYLSASRTSQAGRGYVHARSSPSQEDADTAAELMEQN